MKRDTSYGAISSDSGTQIKRGTPVNFKPPGIMKRATSYGTITSGIGGSLMHGNTTDNHNNHAMRVQRLLSSFVTVTIAAVVYTYITAPEAPRHQKMLGNLCTAVDDAFHSVELKCTTASRSLLERVKDSINRIPWDGLFACLIAVVVATLVVEMPYLINLYRKKRKERHPHFKDDKCVVDEKDNCKCSKMDLID